MSDQISGSHVCKTCETIMVPKKLGKSSFFVELLVWAFCFLLALYFGFIPVLFAIGFSVWRMTGGEKMVCHACGSEAILPVSSPAAEKIIASLGLTEDK